MNTSQHENPGKERANRGKKTKQKTFKVLTCWDSFQFEKSLILHKILIDLNQLFQLQICDFLKGFQE